MKIQRFGGRNTVDIESSDANLKFRMVIDGEMRTVLTIRREGNAWVVRPDILAPVHHAFALLYNGEISEAPTDGPGTER